MNGKGMQTKPQSMKCALSLPLVLALVEFASAYTFLVPVEKSWRIYYLCLLIAGRLYVYYEGRRYYLTDDPTKRLIVFLVNDCIVTLNLEKSRRERYQYAETSLGSMETMLGKATLMNVSESMVDLTNHKLSTCYSIYSLLI
uniref:Uncharacterized protein n=1 Tax=Echinococcus canadensis TaxID=519352 RepID=A0A915EV72_9CEST